MSGHRRWKGAPNNDVDRFGEFPPQMNSPELATPQITNRQADQQSRIRFAEDTKVTPCRSTQMLVLGGIGADQRQSPILPYLLTESALDFSMITTPGSKMAEDDTRKSLPRKRWTSGTPLSNIFSTASTPGVKTPYTSARESLNQQPTPGDYSDKNNESSALTFARSAPLSGYLRKLGKNIPTFKRRFFVLKPSTHLYYFMSPNDTEPRGCIDLDMVQCDENGGTAGCEVREIGSFPDGTFRFELIFDEEAEDGAESVMDDNNSDTASKSSQSSKKRRFQKQSIVLEARTEEIGREWMSKLKYERLSTARNEINSLKTNLIEMKSISNRWEKSACEEAMRADEAERLRNAAISESKTWEEKFTNLNEAIRMLASNGKVAGASSDFLAEAVRGIDLNKTNFSDIATTFHKIHNDFKLATKREEEAKKRIVELERQAKDVESRATKAEVELAKVWEDNCALKIELKKIRKERKILVTEVRSLQAAAKESMEKQEALQAQYDQKQHLGSNDSQGGCRGGASETSSFAQPSRKMNEEERRLVIELEEHVMSGLRLSDQFLTLNGIDPMEVLDDLDNSEKASSAQASNSSHDRSPVRQSTRHASHNASVDSCRHPAMRIRNEASQHDINVKLGSLLDENDDESEVPSDLDDTKTTTPFVSSKNADPFSEINRTNRDYVTESTHGPMLSGGIFQYEETSPTGEHVNQNLIYRFTDTTQQLDSSKKYCAATIEENTSNCAPPVSVASSISESSRSRVTDNGRATTKLECPLRDAGETSGQHRHNSTLGDDGNIYHITFYSNKIGLQFQKVPNESKSTGLLTEAMTADHGPNVDTKQTTAELGRIASISQHSQYRNRQDALSMECFPATPADAVLVCGFIGFDDSTGNSRPQLGARVVAFDGIPVEVGQWTFESIRKSIQARGRPLTLSFRNDSLTPKQRTILTKAVEDLNGTSTSVAHPQGYGGNAPEDTNHRSASSIFSSQRFQSKGKYYSFSDAGSSISSAVAPLVPNLLSNSRVGLPKQQSDFVPDYLRRTSDSVDQMRDHHDFQSGLL
ncbi:hypothetical protein ACHAXA_008905 [Cyclostephanos tholiformis]|uniref:PH domain-containing protein n=1 Tax=Cyclostephanos tholiformis TaxID=382380 RepID=A0ABD3R3E2_9STRA